MDEYDAPEGYYALKAENLCGGCAFWKKSKCRVEQGNCCRSERADKELVIFKKDTQK